MISFLGVSLLMPKHFFLFILLVIGVAQSLYAVSKSNKIEITAKYIESTKTLVKARENVIVYYADSVIKSRYCRLQ